MKDFEKLYQNFLKAYRSWVATRPLMDELEEYGYISARSLIIRKHAWNRYVAARDELQCFHALEPRVNH